MRHHPYTIPDLPPEPLFEVHVEEKRTPERVRAGDKDEARRRISNLLGLTPTKAEIEEVS